MQGVRPAIFGAYQVFKGRADVGLRAAWALTDAFDSVVPGTGMWIVVLRARSGGLHLLGEEEGPSGVLPD